MHNNTTWIFTKANFIFPSYQIKDNRNNKKAKKCKNNSAISFHFYSECDSKQRPIKVDNFEVDFSMLSNNGIISQKADHNKGS